MIELGKLLLDEETAAAFAEWLQALVDQRRREQQKIENEKARAAQDDAWYTKLTAIAEEYATRQGPIECMDAWEQAKAACASWEKEAGYFDVDEYFVMDDDWREAWNNAYSGRIDDMWRAKDGQS